MVKQFYLTHWEDPIRCYHSSQSGLGSNNSNEWVLHIPQSTRTGALPSYGLTHEPPPPPLIPTLKKTLYQINTMINTIPRKQMFKSETIKFDFFFFFFFFNQHSATVLEFFSLDLSSLFLNITIDKNCTRYTKSLKKMILF